MKLVLTKKSTPNSMIMVMGLWSLAGLLVLGILIFGISFFIRSEAERLNEAPNLDAAMPMLDKKGLDYFISRQNKRLKAGSPAFEQEASPSPTPSSPSI